MKLRILMAGLALAGILSSSGLRAQTASASGMFTVQGRLTNTNGTAIADGQHRILTSIFVKGTPTPVYFEIDTVGTSDGIFTVLLGMNKKLTLDSKSNYEVSVAVDGGSEM